jgi:hypothetical protein
MQGWCHAHAAGLAPSVARARQRVKGEAALSSRRRDLRHKACSVRELRRARMRGVVPEGWGSRACPSARPLDGDSSLSAEVSI